MDAGCETVVTAARVRFHQPTLRTWEPCHFGDFQIPDLGEVPKASTAQYSTVSESG